MNKLIMMKEKSPNAPMLFPYDPDQFWQRVRIIIREEFTQLQQSVPVVSVTQYQTPGMEYKPLFKIAEVCDLFQVTKPTIYDWIKHGKLKPYKIRSRVYFLWQDIQSLLSPGATNLFNRK